MGFQSLCIACLNPDLNVIQIFSSLELTVGGGGEELTVSLILGVLFAGFGRL